MGPISKEHMEKVAWIMIWSLHVLYNWLIYQKIMFSLEKGPAQKCYMENSFWIFQHLNAGRNAPCNFIGWLKVNGPFCGHNIWTLDTTHTHVNSLWVCLFVCLLFRENLNVILYSVSVSYLWYRTFKWKLVVGVLVVFFPSASVIFYAWVYLHGFMLDLT